MEGSSVPESESPVPKDTNAEQPQSQKKRLSLPKKLAIGATAGLATLAAAISLNAAKDGGEKTETPITPTPAEKTIAPTIEPTQVVEITPTPEATASPAPTAAPSPETPAPTPTEAPWTHNYLPPEILPPVPGYTPSISLEQAESILDKVFAKYPVLKHPNLGPLKVQIATGPIATGTDKIKRRTFYDPDTHTLILNLVTPDFEGETFHELVHSWDFATKENPQIAPLREVLLSDPQLGADYPSIEKLTAGGEISAYLKYKSGDVLNLEELHLVASQEANAFWIYEDSEDSVDPFKEFLADNVFENNQSQTDYATVADFLNSQTVRELANRNKYWAYAVSEMKTNVGAYETYFERLDSNLPLYRKEQEYINALKLAGRIMLLKDVAGNNPQLPQVFTQKELYQVKLATDARQHRSDLEQVAATVATYQELKNSGRLTGQDQALEAYLNAINDLAISQ